MKNLIIAALFGTLLFASCTKGIEQKITTAFNATILGKGMDCGNAYLIKFDSRVQELPNNIQDYPYYEVNLPDKYKVEGKRINVAFREAQGDELMVCKAMAISYPEIFIVGVDA